LNVEWAGRIPIPTLASRTRIIGGADLSEGVRANGTPLTIAHGRIDGVVPFSSFERLRRLRPDAEAVAWDEVSHMASLTHPELVAALARSIHDR
jgi:pimeloyl-ACP methyl ester carboxylesterase